MIEFDSKTLERYRKHYYKEDLGCLAVQMVAVTILAVVFSGYDVYEIGLTDEVKSLIKFRMLSVLVGCLLLFAFWKGTLTSLKWDIVAALAFMIVAVYSCSLSVVRSLYTGNSLEFFAMANVVYTIIYFLMIPIENHWIRICPALVFLSITAVHAVWFLKSQSAAAFIVVICVLSVSFGAFISIQLIERRKKIFCHYLQENQEKIQLKRRGDLERQLMEAERKLLTCEAELKLLNFQIKPHFLYNVLGSAIVLCRSKPDLAATALEKLVVYLQCATNADLESTTVSRELEVVRAYLDIQQIRMNSRLRFEIHCEPVSAVKIPVYAIQTLVENSVIHGLRKCEDGGRIVVTVTETPDNLCVSVEDNGVGMDTEKLFFLHEKEPEEYNSLGKRSIGLWNVNRRLKILGSIGLVVKSQEGIGTKIGFELPLRSVIGGINA